MNAILNCSSSLCSSCGAPIPPSAWRNAGQTHHLCHRCKGLTGVDGQAGPVPNARAYTNTWDAHFLRLPDPVKIRVMVNPRGADARDLAARALRLSSQQREAAGAPSYRRPPFSREP